MTIKKKLIGGVILTAISILVIVSVGIYAMQKINSDIRVLTDKSTPAQIKTMELQQTVEKISADFMRLGLATDTEETKRVSRNVEERISLLKKTMEELNGLGVSGHGMDPSVFNSLHAEIVGATEQRQKCAAIFKTEIVSVNDSLAKVDSIISGLGRQVYNVGTQASRNLATSQDGSVMLNNTIKKMLVLQNKLKDLELMLNDLETAKNKYRLTPFKEKAKAISDSVRAFGYIDGEPEIIKEVKEEVTKVSNQITMDNKGLIALKTSILSGNAGDESEYLSQKKGIEKIVAGLSSKMYEAIDPLEVRLVKDKQKMEEAMRFQERSGSISSISNGVAVRAKELGDYAKLIMLASNGEELQRAMDGSNLNQKQIVRDAETLKKPLLIMKQTALLKDISSMVAAVNGAASAIGRIAEAKKSAIASESLMQKAVEAVKTVSQEQSKRGEEQVQSISQKQQDVVTKVGRTVKASMTLMAALSFAIIIIMLLINGKTASSVTGSINVAEGLISTMSGGDFSKQVQVKSNDEIGKMCGDLNGLVEKLSESLSTISERAKVVATAVAEQAETADQLTKRAVELADEAGNLSTAGEELSATVLEVSRNAGSTSDFAKNAQQNAVQGSEIIAEAIKGIEVVSQSTKIMSTTLRELSESSQKVGDVVVVIEEIAAQTNLLALNAAIEAARAGDQGRGFAVVADEVRNLAEKTSTSTVEISQIIKTIQANAGNVTVAINDAMEKIRVVVSLAGTSSQALDGIVDSVDKISGMSQQIAVSACEQSQVVDTIASRVVHVSKVAGDFSQGAGQIVKATQDLDKIASELHTLTSRFKVA